MTVPGIVFCTKAYSCSLSSSWSTSDLTRSYSFIHTFVHSFIYSSNSYSFIRSHIRLFIHQTLIHLFIHSYIRSFIHSISHSFVHLLSARFSQIRIVATTNAYFLFFIFWSWSISCLIYDLVNWAKFNAFGDLWTFQRRLIA